MPPDEETPGTGRRPEGPAREDLGDQGAEPPPPPRGFGSQNPKPGEGPAENGRPADGERPPERSITEREVKVVNVFQYEDKQEHHFVLLQDSRDRKLPIWIGQPEALAIYVGLQKENANFHRPFTHDLLRSIVEKLGAKIERLTIDDMWQDTFYARLVISVDSRWMDIDCRPSDGIAVALRAGAPIYVSDEVLEACKIAEE